MVQDGILPENRLTARILAHVVLEQIQAAPQPAMVASLLAQAKETGWQEICTLLHFSQVIYAGIQGAGFDEIQLHSNAMLEAAKATGEDILIALAMACRACMLRGSELEDAIESDLANAVAMLDDATSTASTKLVSLNCATELPVAYVECGQAYHRRGLWELEQEMYDRAASAMLLPVDPELRSVTVFIKRVLEANQLEVAVSLGCALLEVGKREAARDLVSNCHRLTADQMVDLPPVWVIQLRAVNYLLAAIACEPAPTLTEDFKTLASGIWGGYQACLLLGDAVRAIDTSDTVLAMTCAEQAMQLFQDDFHLPSVRMLALHLSAQTLPHNHAAMQYVHELTQLRWNSRLQILGSARARLAAARVMRQSEQLSRQAYIDELTGLANRHALARHLDRLRKSDPSNGLAVVLIDVDHFKTINDTFGHAIGDEVLRVLGNTIFQLIRTTDLAVRLGGDEFMVLLDLQITTDALARAQSIVDAVSTYPWQVITEGLNITISAGQANGFAQDVDALTHLADSLLYKAKDTGRGKAVTLLS